MSTQKEEKNWKIRMTLEVLLYTNILYTSKLFLNAIINLP